MGKAIKYASCFRTYNVIVIRLLLSTAAPVIKQCNGDCLYTTIYNIIKPMFIKAQRNLKTKKFNFHRNILNRFFESQPISVGVHAILVIYIIQLCVVCIFYSFRIRH